jgi:hypothetical protein
MFIKFDEGVVLLNHRGRNSTTPSLTTLNSLCPSAWKKHGGGGVLSFPGHFQLPGIAQWYNAGLRAGLSGVRKFFLHHRVQTGSGAHPASYIMGTRGSFPRGKSAGA